MGRVQAAHWVLHGGGSFCLFRWQGCLAGVWWWVQALSGSTSGGCTGGFVPREVSGPRSAPRECVLAVRFPTVFGAASSVPSSTQGLRWMWCGAGSVGSGWCGVYPLSRAHIWGPKVQRRVCWC